LLTAQPTTIFDRRIGSVVELKGGRIVDQLLHEYNGGEYYRPPNGFYYVGSTAYPGRSLFELVKSTRRNLAVNDQLLGQDIGFYALRRFSWVVTGAQALQNGEERIEQSFIDGLQLRLRLARPDESPRAGSVLIAHPVSCLSQPSLHGAVILLTKMEKNGFVQGVVTNRLTGMTLSDVLTERGKTLIPDDSGLRGHWVFTGGDVSTSELGALHYDVSKRPMKAGDEDDAVDDDDEDADKSNQRQTSNSNSNISSPVVLSEMDHLLTLLSRGVIDPAEAKLVVGYAGWTIDQLNSELQRNVWFHALPAGVGLVEEQPLDALVTCSQSMTSQPPERIQRALWQAALNRLGSEFSNISELTSDHKRIWEYMESVWKEQNEELSRRLEEVMEEEEAGSGDSDRD